MSVTLKLIFDENFGVPLVEAFGQLLKVVSEFSIEIESLPRMLKTGLKDADWVPRIKQDDSAWIVITQDRRRRQGGDKLASVCREHGVTHIALSGRLGQEKQLNKVRAILAVWEEFGDVGSSPPGTMFCLRYTPSRSVVLERRPLSAA